MNAIIIVRGCRATVMYCGLGHRFNRTRWMSDRMFDRNEAIEWACEAIPDPRF